MSTKKLRQIFWLLRSAVSSSIKVKLTLLFTLGGLIPTILLSLFIYSYSHQLISQKEFLYISDGMQSASHNLSRVISDMEGKITEVLSYDPLYEVLASNAQPPSTSWFFNTKKINNQLKTKSISNEMPYTLTIVSNKGYTLDNGNNVNMYERLDGAPARAIVEQRWNTSIFSRTVGEQAQSQVVTLGKTIRRGGQLLGVVMIDLAKDNLDSLFSAMNTEQLSTFALNRQGVPFYTTGGTVSAEYVVKNLSTLQQKSGQFVKIDGKHYLCIYDTSALNCSVLGLVPQEYIYKTSDLYKSQSAILCVVVVLQMLLYAWVISRLFSKRVKTLNDAVAAFSGNMHPTKLAVTSRDEIGQLTASFNQMSHQIAALVEQVKTDEQTKKQLEMAALRSQFNPHMLYNTLNTITYLAKLQGVENIQEVSEALSRLLRRLSSDSSEFISIRQEVEYITQYVTIKKYNLLANMQLYVLIDPGLEEVPIMKLLLQPFVENSIIHGFANLTRAARLDIHFYEKDGYINVRIADNGNGLLPEQNSALQEWSGESTGSHVGIRNTVRRLYLTYNNDCNFNIESEVQEFTIIEIAYPKEWSDAQSTTS